MQNFPIFCGAKLGKLLRNLWISYFRWGKTWHIDSEMQSFIFMQWQSLKIDVENQSFTFSQVQNLTNLCRNTEFHIFTRTQLDKLLQKCRISWFCSERLDKLMQNIRISYFRRYKTRQISAEYHNFIFSEYKTWHIGAEMHNFLFSQVQNLTYWCRISEFHIFAGTKLDIFVQKHRISYLRRRKTWQICAEMQNFIFLQGNGLTNWCRIS